MNDALLSVLLLAWDDADPAPADFGAPLPAGAALRTVLASHVRLTAILPQKPAAPATGQEEQAASARAEPASELHSGPEYSTDYSPTGRPAPVIVAPDGPDAPASTAGPEISTDPAVTLPVYSEEGAFTANLTSPSRPVSTFSEADGSLTAPLREATETADPATSGLSSGAPVTPAAASPEPALGQPVVIGLADFTLAELQSYATRWGSPARTTAAGQGAWLMPAAPYVGGSAPSEEPAESASPASESVDDQAASTPAVAPAIPTAQELATPAGSLPEANASASIPLLFTSEPVDLGDDLEFDSQPPLVGILAGSEDRNGDATDDFAGAEPGAAEAADLEQAADDLTLAPPETPPLPSALPAALASLKLPDTRAPSVTAVPVVVPPVEELFPGSAPSAVVALPFRVIQYARFAAQLLAGGQGFDLIFSASWPSWLAAVEVRQLTGRPLVLYVAELPSVQATPRARGWLLELEHQALRRADMVLVPTTALAQYLSENYSLAQPPQVLLSQQLPINAAPLAVDSPLFAAALLPELQVAAKLRV